MQTNIDEQIKTVHNLSVKVKAKHARRQWILAVVVVVLAVMAALHVYSGDNQPFNYNKPHYLVIAYVVGLLVFIWLTVIFAAELDSDEVSVRNAWEDILKNPDVGTLTLDQVGLLNDVGWRPFTFKSGSNSFLIDPKSGTTWDLDSDSCTYSKVPDEQYPDPAVANIKDHEIREFVNDLTDIAKKFAETEQLRERLKHRVDDFLDSTKRKN